MRRTHRFHLTSDERAQLEDLARNPRAAAKKVLRARAMLLADESAPQGAWSDSKITQATGLSPSTLERLRHRVCEVGPLAALERKRRQTPPVPPLIDGEKEARLIALACSQAPEGRRRWTLRLLAERMVELEIVDSISYETVRQTLKKTTSSPGVKPVGASRPRKTPSS